MYTAGTTGQPKGAILSQGASFWNVLNLNLPMDFTSKDRSLVVLPMFHIGGIGLFTLPMLYDGGTVVIQRTFDPVQTLTLLKQEDITLFFGVPAIFLLLIQHPDFEAAALNHVRVVMSGGAPLPVSLVRQYHEADCAPAGIRHERSGTQHRHPGKELALRESRVHRQTRLSSGCPHRR